MSLPEFKINDVIFHGFFLGCFFSVNFNLDIIRRSILSHVLNMYLMPHARFSKVDSDKYDGTQTVKNFFV